MGMFLIEKDTNVRAIPPNKEWHPSNVRLVKTKKTNVFEKHEVILDPATGRLSGHIGKFNPNVIGGAYENAGWYGFKCSDTGWTMLVHHNNVQYG